MTAREFLAGTFGLAVVSAMLWVALVIVIACAP